LSDSERELRLYQMLEEIKGQVRQNTLLLQAILRRENAAEVVNEEFQFPLRSMTGIKDLEDRLSNRDTQRSLVNSKVLFLNLNENKTEIKWMH